MVGIKTAPGPGSVYLLIVGRVEDVGRSLVTGWKSDDDHFFVVLFHYPFVKTAFGKNVRKREKLYLIINFSKAYLIE